MTTRNWLDAFAMPFDPEPAIAAWRSGDAEAISMLWERLYHQGDVGTASYAAVPGLVSLARETHHADWNAYALIASIEEGRSNGGPSVPDDLESDYRAAWAAILPLALRNLAEASDDLLVRSLIAVVAQSKGQQSLAALALCTEDERQEMLGIPD